MTPPDRVMMLAFVVMTYLSTYGAGEALLRMARLKFPSAPERLGMACAIGGVLLGWVGYLAAVARLPLMAVSMAWVTTILGVTFALAGAIERRAASRGDDGEPDGGPDPALAGSRRAAAADAVVFINPRHETKPAPGQPGNEEIISHRWGYVSGLLDARVYLDNEDMARKFGQGATWDERLGWTEYLLRSKAPAAIGAVFSREQIRWVLLEGDEELRPVLPAIGYREVFAREGVTVYQRGVS